MDTPPSPSPIDPSLFSLSDIQLLPDDSPMARHSHLSGVHASSHARHQSVPSFPSPQNSPRTSQQPTRGLAKLTLVERLSRESIPSPGSGDGPYTGSPKSASPTRFDDGSPRPSHSPRRTRMSLTIPPTKAANTPIATASPITSPLRPTPLVMPTPTSKHVSGASLGEINLSPTHPVHERAMTSPGLSTSLEEVAALDDANATFLTLIAFQERRVVEIREELARAESELDLLKQQWTRQQLKLTRSARQEHVRQNSLTKLEQQMSAATETSSVEKDDSINSPHILVAGKRLAEGVRDGFFTIMEDLKSAAANESTQTTPRQRGRSPTRVVRDEVGLGIVTEKKDPPLWKPRRPSPVKRSIRRESDGSDTTEPLSSDPGSTRASSISSITSDLKSPNLGPSTPTSNSTMTRSPDSQLSPWAWTMASRIINQSQRHATTLFATVERHLDTLAAGPEPPLHPRRARRLPSGHMRTETVQF